MNGQAGEEVVARGRSAIISHLIDIIQHRATPVSASGVLTTVTNAMMVT